jgi:hypothetical protein
MKLKIATTLAAVAAIAGSMTALAQDDESHYQDLYELKLLHAAFHQAVSHAGTDAAAKLEHLKAVLAVWTQDGALITGCPEKCVTYGGARGKGTPNTPSCDVGTFTLCDLYANHAGAFVLGRDWVSLTPIFTEAITVLDSDHANIYFQCIYFDVNNNDALKSNVSFGVPAYPDSGQARKVNGHWLLSYGVVATFTPPTLDVDSLLAEDAGN